MNQTTPFLIVITKPLTFRDSMGTVIRTFEKGDVLKATANLETYFVTTLGSIYHDEARCVNALEQVTYSHISGDSSIRFQQYAKDPVPPWAVELRLTEAE